MSQLFSSMERTFKKCVETAKAKNHDYAGTEKEYSNFERCASLGISPEVAIMIRLQDKMARLERSFVSKLGVADESVENTIEDAINYLAILKARREFEQHRAKLADADAASNLRFPRNYPKVR